MTTIATTLALRITALKHGLEVLADAADVDYLSEALKADSASVNAHLMTNTLAIVSADGEKRISSILTRTGRNTITELRVALGIPETAACAEVASRWRNTVHSTRLELSLQLGAIGVPAEMVESITRHDAETLYFTADEMVEVLELLNPYQDRTVRIASEDYVLIS
jgi:hypothetical protein